LTFTVFTYPFVNASKNKIHKIKGSIGLRKKLSMVIATNLTSICCVYKEKFKTTHTKNVASIQIQKVATYDSDRKKIYLIPNKSFRYYNLQSSIIFRRIHIKLIFHNCMLHLSEFVWTLRSSLIGFSNNFLLIDATDK